MQSRGWPSFPQPIARFPRGKSNLAQASLLGQGTTSQGRGHVTQAPQPRGQLTTGQGTARAGR